MSSQPKSLHFGAGNIGRGFIGLLLSESGYHVVFSDVITSIIDNLNAKGAYDVHILDKDHPAHHVSNVSGIMSQSDSVITYLSDPSIRLVTTAVGPNILPRIAPTLAKGLLARQKANAGPINIIACENMVDQTSHLAGFVYQHVGEDSKEWVDQNVGFANCSVDRIVPLVSEPSGEKPLDVKVEAFYEWIVDGSLLKAPIEPKITGMQLTNDLKSYIERKLFTLNCGHAIAAYLGHLKKYKTVDQAIADQDILTIVKGALDEGGKALVKKHNFSPIEHSKYVEKVLVRFANPMVKDDVTRIGRQPLRKLGKGDRLLGPLNMAIGYKMEYDFLAKGVAAAFLYEVEDDSESVELQETIERVGISKALTQVAGFEDGSEVHKKVLDAYRELSRTLGK